mgnify:CR=1 FL=1
MNNKLKHFIKYIMYNVSYSYLVFEVIIVFIYCYVSESKIIPFAARIAICLMITIVLVAVFIRMFVYTRKYSTNYMKITPAIFAKSAWINQSLRNVKKTTKVGLTKDMLNIITKLKPGITYYAYTHELVKLNLDRLSKKGVIENYVCEKGNMKKLKKKFVINLKLAEEKQQFYYISFKFKGTK